MGLAPIINRTIRQGRLLTLNSEAVNTDFAYWLVAPKNSAVSEHFEAVYQWITSLFETLE